jgi:hypothetical protein
MWEAFFSKATLHAIDINPGTQQYWAAGDDSAVVPDGACPRVQIAWSL